MHVALHALGRLQGAGSPLPGRGPFVQSVRALLGDMNDRAITTRTGPKVIGGIDGSGGPGNDVLTGSPAEDVLDGGGGTNVLTGSPAEDVLDGGGGTDVLTGGAGGDTLTVGDRDGAAAGLAPDADRLDGGPGVDTLSYSQRSRGVVVDLAGTIRSENRVRATSHPASSRSEAARATTASPATATPTTLTAAEAASG